MPMVLDYCALRPRWSKPSAQNPSLPQTLVPHIQEQALSFPDIWSPTPTSYTLSAQIASVSTAFPASTDLPPQITVYVTNTWILHIQVSVWVGQIEKSRCLGVCNDAMALVVKHFVRLLDLIAIECNRTETESEMTLANLRRSVFVEELTPPLADPFGHSKENEDPIALIVFLSITNTIKL
ncbi:hypothetical protein BDN72DRAFT_863685 [Pluteus cervinus]|uniref:Uncharacterized protein n=1 Tax=Pluteus cervinus TaxID=181527 RepID=A0ACD3A6W3_9AGAR|nr:hypothetical protein BDN72DRAFT_863685 [Pluteus cervinus]